VIPPAGLAGLQLAVDLVDRAQQFVKAWGLLYRPDATQFPTDAVEVTLREQADSYDAFFHDRRSRQLVFRRLNAFMRQRKQLFRLSIGRSRSLSVRSQRQEAETS
jgi:hypothetical protein